MAVRTAEIKPCKHLPVIYGLRLNPASAVTAITCKCTLKPENPTINDVSISFSNMLLLRFATLRTPVENSKSPETSESKTVGIGIRSNSVWAIAEKNIIEKHTVSMFFDAASRGTATVCDMERSFVFIRVGGELCCDLP